MSCVVVDCRGWSRVTMASSPAIPAWPLPLPQAQAQAQAQARRMRSQFSRVKGATTSKSSLNVGFFEGNY